MKTFSESEENYIKALYHLGAGSFVSNGDLADRLGAKGPSVTQAVKRLEVKGLVAVVPYKGIRLTAQGSALALDILRKHRLWEVFLVDHLHFGWEEVHDIAEQLEHVQSPDLVNRLSEFLGHPKVDPHGDPIPAGNGKLEASPAKPIHVYPAGTTVVVRRVEDAGVEFFRRLDALQISLGKSYQLKSKSSFDGSLELVPTAEPATTEAPPFFLSKRMSSHIYVEEL